MSTDPNSTSDPVSFFVSLARGQRHIRDTWRHVIELEGSPPGSDVPWPVNRLPWSEAEMRARMGEPIQADQTSPYAPYDAWLDANCGPDGYARVGDTVGIRDQASAEEFLRWIYPAQDDTKLGLARMITKVQPNKRIVDEIIGTIGDEVISILMPAQIAGLTDRIYSHLRATEANIQREIISGGAVWDETRKKMRAIQLCE